MENSKIEWTDHTFNPWIGCTKVSTGCANCYAETLMDKRYGRVKWGPRGTRVRTSAAYWKKPLKWNRDAEKAGKRARVFCASLADVFEDRPELEEWRIDLLFLIQSTPHLDWLLLTKRPENVMEMIDGGWQSAGGDPVTELPTNIWIGTSIENQEQADRRIPELLKIPAAVRFLSMEPLLGVVDLAPWLNYISETDDWGLTVDGFDPEFHWVIVGGESGQNARPVHPDWVRSIRDQCQAASIPFFFKQWGDFGDFEIGDTLKNAGRKAGIKKGGRLLDGCKWSELPTRF